MLYTFGWTLFLLPYQIVTGGVTGVAAVIYYGTGIPIYFSYFIINAILLVAALKILGLKFMVKPSTPSACSRYYWLWHKTP